LEKETPMSNFKLSPSDFAFLWEECKRCFYLKVVQGFPRPPSIFPRIFMVIDSKMNACFDGVRAEGIAAGVPSGVVAYGQKWVQSQPIAAPDSPSTCFIRGRFDTVVAFDDGTYGVIDFKTTGSGAAHLAIYSRQLHAYAYALENPALGKFALGPISRLGLLVFRPHDFVNQGGDAASLEGSMRWIEIPRDDDAFLQFIGQVISVLEQPEPPESAPSCRWCQYREASRETGF
jgi:hypothetical protein